MADEIHRDTPAWKFQVWAAFVIAMAITLVGIGWMPIDFWMRGFLAMGVLFAVGSAFSLAKTTRDDLESKKLINRIAEAKAERILREYELGHERAVASAGGVP